MLYVVKPIKLKLKVLHFNHIKIVRLKTHCDGLSS